MTQNRFKRKLTTIFSADVAGYSRLMGEDEAATVKTLERYKGILFELIRQHRGLVIDSPGDNLLAEFTSVVDAVQCAVAAQKELQARNTELPENRRMQFRIGVNLGDVIEEESRIYGDGVNIAARLESLADPGGICLSKTAFDQIETKLPFGYEYLGEHSVKNITKPVRAFRVILEPRVTKRKGSRHKPGTGRSRRLAVLFLVGALVAVSGLALWQLFLSADPPSTVSPEKKVDSKRSALPLTDKPSIAVLPFLNMSDDPRQEYFSDGISEDIITDLSKISGLIVIARNSSFTYKGKSVTAQKIGQDLQVRYLLEGSVRKAKDQLRINAQLIDALNGQHLWAERYDGDISDIFALQDKITRKIISALALILSEVEQGALVDRGTSNLQAYDEFLKGWQGYRLLTKEGFAEAKIHLEKALEIDPEFARAYAALAVLYWKAIQNAAPELREGLGLNNRAAKSAVQAKPQLLVKKAMKRPTALTHGLMSQFYLFRYQHDEALTEIERAVAMDPNDPELYAWMSQILWLLGKKDEAVESAKMGLRLDPINPSTYLIQLGKANIPDGDLQESLQVLEKVKRLNPGLSGVVALSQSIIYGIQGKDEEAHTQYEIFIKHRMSPVRSLNSILLFFPFADAKKLDRIAEALIKAGAPGSPTDYYKILKVNRINGQELNSLLFGHKITGVSMSTGKQLWWEWEKNGEFKIIGPFEDIGKSWVEGDVLFIQFRKQFGGLPYGATIYRNPDGSMENKNQYFMVSDIGSITPFASAE